LTGQDTFHVGCSKETGRISHQVACDCLSSFGAANVYDSKTTKVSTDVVENHVAKKIAPAKTERILTDCGTEHMTWHQEAIPNHEFEKACNRLGIKHATTRVKHPWTNGYGERLDETLLDEFCAAAFRKKRYGHIEESVAN
jgi:transposase InsO family protein